MTQEEFVEIFNRKMKEKLKKTLSRGSYGPYEKGLRYPKKYIKLFAEFYGVTVGYLQGKELRYDLADIEKLTLNGRELSGKKLENALKYIEFLLADDD
ncbi:hypothetical protein [Seinonella peptonophila]|uniref:hypothetical protein n=1 Tax=Seinonella peptonophila TaxID=112248 RepID=UPI001114B60E|nr:hypothetical protein [Seinonella peptonophila]